MNVSLCLAYVFVHVLKVITCSSGSCTSIIDYCSTTRHELINNIYMQRFWELRIAEISEKEEIDPCEYNDYCAKALGMLYYKDGNSDVLKETICYLLDVCSDGVKTLNLNGSINRRDIPDSVEDFRTMIVDDMLDVCPYASICGRNATLSNDKDNFVSCCLDCSCEPDCGLLNNCCFDDQHNYDIVETLQMQCIVNRPSYLMVDKCFMKTAAANVVSNHSHCASFDIYPVSSNVTHLIYINEQCALCNGVTRFSTWNGIAACKKTDEIFVTAETCSINFLPPIYDVKWVQYFHCDPIDSKYEYEGYNYTSDFDNHSFFTAACLEVNARHVSLPVNLYCNLEYTYYYDPSALCEYNSLLDIRYPPDTLIYLLDTSMYKKVRDTVQAHGSQNTECVKHTVRNPTGIFCRRIECPETMIRIDDKCVYTVLQWIDAEFGIQLSLTTATGEKRTDWAMLTTENIESIKLFIKTHCCFGYKIDMQLIKISETIYGQIYVQTIVQVVFLDADIEPSIFFANIRECLKSDLSIKTADGQESKINVQFYKFNKWINIKDTENDEQSSTITLLGVNIKGHAINTDIVLSKMFLCEQVELRDDEITRIDNDHLLINHNGIVLGDNEFSITKDEKENVVFRVCLDEYMNNLPTVNVASKTSVLSNMVVCFVWLFII